MRILAIGGAGDMGRAACAAAASDDAIDHVVVADLDGDRAAKVAEAIGPKASAMALDVTDDGALGAAAAEADLVLNTVGPFYVFGRRVLQAAIDAGVHYADINDDWEPTIEMLEMSDDAASAGITALIGMGASPGVTNILAAVAARELDDVSRLLTGWRAGAGIPKPTSEGPAPEASAAVDHWIHNCSEPIRLWRDGGPGDYDPLEELAISYPGRGAGTVWTCGHPEPITLPRTYPDLAESMNVMVSRPGLIDAVRRVVARVRSGEFTVHQAANQLILEPGRRGPAAGEAAPLPDMFALAEGTAGGEGKRVGVFTDAMPDGDMDVLTGVPLAIGAGMIARGEITTRGVVAPEAVVDPDLFFQRIAAFSGNGRPRRAHDRHRREDVTPMPGSTVLVEGDADVTTITLNRPERLNALNDALLEALAEAVTVAGNRCRVVVLRGAGRAFSSGHDLTEPAADDPDEVRETTERFHTITRLLRQSPAPVVSQVHGYAIGGGAEIALTCDFIVAAASTTFRFTETAVGLVVTNGFTELLPRTAGPTVAKEVIMLGEPFDAAQARAWGLVTRVAEDDAIEAETARVVELLLSKSPNALRLAKRLINSSSDVRSAMQRETRASVEASLHDDAREAKQAFADKRPPRFTI